MNLKQKLKKNQLSIGCWLTISNPLIPEILSPAGFDWFCVDLEHTSITLDKLLPIIISIENQNKTPLVRVGENNPNLIKRVMDCGSHGVIVPNIKNKDEAMQAVSSVKYPPLGSRGVGLFKAQGYGNKFDESWMSNKDKFDRYDMISIVEDISNIFGLKKDDILYEIHHISRNEREYVVLSISMDDFIEKIKNNSQERFKNLVKFPNIRRDLSFLIDASISYKEICKLVEYFIAICKFN